MVEQTTLNPIGARALTFLSRRLSASLRLLDNPFNLDLYNGLCSCYRFRYRYHRLLGEYLQMTNPSPMINCLQGRAGLVAYRRSKGGLNAAGKAFYKG